MGSVREAEREDPRRTVALKLLPRFEDPDIVPIRGILPAAAERESERGHGSEP